MRVLIDATPLLLRSGGVKTYLYHLLLHLRQVSGEELFRAFPFLDRMGDLNHEASVLGFAGTLPRLGLLYFVNLPGNPALEWICRKADLFHCTSQIHHPPRSIRLTTTVHDLTCHIMPEVHTAANVRAENAYADQVIRRAAGLIAVSENTRCDALRLFGLHPDQIEVIYPGVANAFFCVTDDIRTAVLARYGLDRKHYVLFVGTIEPRKNLETLLDAYEQLCPDIREEFDLVVAGLIGWSAESTLARLTSGIPGLRFLGYVPEVDLPALTAGATVVAYPSLYEGFGFPVAQAMACGVPVVTSSVSCLPEVTGGAALLVDPHSTVELRSALGRLLLSPSVRQHLGQEGRVRASQLFRWEDCSRRALRFFEHVVGSRSRL
jgi:alpha-1,3-rhamnosyl/mannosyltransferase